MATPRVETKVTKSWIGFLVLIMTGAIFMGIGESFENILSSFK